MLSARIFKSIFDFRICIPNGHLWSFPLGSKLYFAFPRRGMRNEEFDDKEFLAKKIDEENEEFKKSPNWRFFGKKLPNWRFFAKKFVKLTIFVKSLGQKVSKLAVLEVYRWVIAS